MPHPFWLTLYKEKVAVFTYPLLYITRGVRRVGDYEDAAPLPGSVKSIGFQGFPQWCPENKQFLCTPLYMTSTYRVCSVKQVCVHQDESTWTVKLLHTNFIEGLTRSKPLHSLPVPCQGVRKHTHVLIRWVIPKQATVRIHSLLLHQAKFCNC